MNQMPIGHSLVGTGNPYKEELIGISFADPYLST